MKAAGLKGFSTHKLRHTAATLMYQTGNVDILTLKQLLGHSNVSTTQIYTHLQEFQVRSAIEANPLGGVSARRTALKKEDTEQGDLYTTVQGDSELHFAADRSTSDPVKTASLAEENLTGDQTDGQPMAALNGAAKEGFGLDSETLDSKADKELQGS